MPTRNTGIGGVPSHQQSSPHPLGGSDPVCNNSPSANSALSEQEQHLDIPSTPITHNYCATVKDVTDDEDEDDTTTS